MGSVLRSASRHAVCALLLGTTSGCVLSHGTAREDVPRIDVPADRPGDVPGDVSRDSSDVIDELAMLDVPDVSPPPDAMDVMSEDAITDVMGEDAVPPPDVMDVMGEDATPPPPDALVCTAPQLLCGAVCCLANQVCNSGACAAPTSCLQLKTALPMTTSGQYMIDHDGMTATPPRDLYCDMTTQSGGWTEVFRGPPQSDSPATVSALYVTGPLLASATRMLFAIRNPSSANVVVGTNATSFPLPTAPSVLRENLFAQSRYSESVNGLIVNETAIAGSFMLVVGTDGFPGDNNCGTMWNSDRAGRICIVGTAAPFYNSFSSERTSYPDYCGASDAPYNAASTLCTASRVFSVSVR